MQVRFLLGTPRLRSMRALRYMSKVIQIVVIGAIRHKGKYLLTQRIHKDPKVHGKWQLPGGGLEAGETLLQCLHREIKEETNLTLKNVQLIPKVFEVLRSDWHGVFVAFICEPNSSSFNIKLDDEASAWQWLSAKQITNHASD